MWKQFSLPVLQAVWKRYWILLNVKGAQGMTNNKDLYFIPIIARALNNVNTRDAMDDAFEEIRELGSQPEYLEGFRQFMEFTRAALKPSGVRADQGIQQIRDVIYGLLYDLATDTFTGNEEQEETLISTFRSIPHWNAEYERIKKEAEAFPELEMDRSLQVLTPIEYQSAKESLLRHKGDLKIYPLGDVSDALRIFATDSSIVLGSLKTGFFGLKTPPGEAQDPIGRTVGMFVEGNEKRFWDALGRSLMNRMVENGRLLLQAYVDFHLKNQSYPERFGEQLFRLVVSLPPSTRTLDDLFPLVSPEFCIQLTQHAKKNDIEDVRKLYKALFGDGFGERPFAINAASAAESHEHDTENALFERLLAELSKENLAKKIGHPFDNARGSYAPDSVTVKDGFTFNDAITSFYGHIFRHIGSPEGSLKRSALASEAIELVRAAFARKGGYNAALAEGKHGINGGMRLVFDSMTEHLKHEKMKNHTGMVLKVSIDPLDQDAKIRLMKVFMERIGPQLPVDLRGKSPEQLSFHWEEVILYYMESLDRVSELLKTL